MYVPTDDVDSAHQRALAASPDIVRLPAHAQFGSGNDAYAFTMRDLQGYLWTFGTYPGAHGPIGLRPNPASLGDLGKALRRAGADAVVVL
jgi:hypothetical protein